MSKVKKNYSVSQWLKNYDRKLYDAVENASALGVLKASKESGLTFLYPEDASLKSKIISLLDYNDPEGVKMLQSLIIVDNLPTPQAWMTKKDDIPSKLGIKVGVTSADRDSVKLSNGAVIKPLEPSKGNVSVWSYNGNTAPMQGGVATYDYVKKGAKKPKVRGGMFNKGLNPFGLAKTCEGKAIALISAGKYGKCNPYVDVLVSYLSWLYKNNETEYNKCLQSVSYCSEATFYNTFEPYKSGSGSSQFSRWLDETQGITLVGSTADKYLYYVKEAANSKEAKEARGRLCSARKPLLEKRYPSMLRSSLVAAYGGNNKKAQKDEIQFMFLDRLNDVLSSSNAAEQYCDLCFEVEIMQRSKTKYIVTDSLSAVNDHIDSVAFYSSAVLFVLSDCFMYAPYSLDDQKQIKELGCDVTGDSLEVVYSNNVTVSNLTSDSVIVITQQSAKQRLETLKDNQTTNNVQKAIAEALNLLDKADVIPALKAVCVKWA